MEKSNALKRPLLFLAPMAGYTESPFRLLVKRLEPSVILVSELLSAEALRRRHPKTLQMAFFAPEESPHFGIQLFGKDPKAFIEAAKIVEDLGADFVDINLGCPSPKVVGSGYGSALLKDISHTAKLIESLRKAISIPVTVKMRLGFYDDKNLIPAVSAFEQAGATWVVIHGRTAVQKFKGNASWDPIYEVKEKVGIPIIGNGDITSAQIAKNRLKNLDGVMIGRAALKNPWIFSQTRALFSGKPLPPLPPLKERLNFFLEHARLAVSLKGEVRAMLELRKHLARFIRGIPKASSFRHQLISVKTLKELEEIFESISAVINKKEA